MYCTQSILHEQAVCQRMGLDTGDRLETNARKLKFLVNSLPDNSKFPPFEDFDVIHDYLQTNSKKTQARLRKRGQKGKVVLVTRNTSK